MVLFSVRHEGSPEPVDGLTGEDVLDGVKDGIWSATDEARGPNETQWQSLETHPVFANAMAEFEPPPPPIPEDETRLDMNPLIDVALVLLIFFMLTATYEQMRKEFQPPPTDKEKKQGKAITDTQLKELAIRVSAKMEDGKPVFRVENEVVDEAKLEDKFMEWIAKSDHARLAMEIDPKVPWSAVVRIQDAAAGAKISEIIRVTRPISE